MIRELLGFNASESFMDSRIELRADTLYRNNVQAPKSVLHLLQNQFDPGAKLLLRPARPQRQLEVIHDAEKRLYGRRNRIVPHILPLFSLALAHIVELSL